MKKEIRKFIIFPFFFKKNEDLLKLFCIWGGEFLANDKSPHISQQNCHTKEAKLNPTYLQNYIIFFYIWLPPNSSTSQLLKKPSLSLSLFLFSLYPSFSTFLTQLYLSLLPTTIYKYNLYYTPLVYLK